MIFRRDLRMVLLLGSLVLAANCGGRHGYCVRLADDLDQQASSCASTDTGATTVPASVDVGTCASTLKACSKTDLAVLNADLDCYEQFPSCAPSHDFEDCEAAVDEQLSSACTVARSGLFGGD